jgi:hypothetical protein
MVLLPILCVRVSEPTVQVVAKDVPSYFVVASSKTIVVLMCDLVIVGLRIVILVMPFRICTCAFFVASKLQSLIEAS